MLKKQVGLLKVVIMFTEVKTVFKNALEGSRDVNETRRHNSQGPGPRLRSYLRIETRRCST